MNTIGMFIEVEVMDAHIATCWRKAYIAAQHVDTVAERPAIDQCDVFMDNGHVWTVNASPARMVHTIGRVMMAFSC